MRLLIIMSLITLVSCAGSSTKLSKKGKMVDVLDRYSKKDCNVVDKVVGYSKKGLESLAQNHARNQAASAGGNGITYDETVQNGSEVKIHSTVYSCPE